MGRVEGKIAIVTGGSQGLGKAISMRLAEEGAFVNIFDVNNAEPVVEEVRNMGKNAEAYRVNVANNKEVADAVNKIIDKHEG